MPIRSMNEIYQVVEKVLKKASEPMTCTALMDEADVRKAATHEFGADLQVATNKLSDVLGFMWRRDVLRRHPAPPDSKARARYAYSWNKAVAKATEAPATPPLPPATKGKKPVFTITESTDAVTIEFEHVTLIVKRK